MKLFVYESLHSVQAVSFVLVAMLKQEKTPCKVQYSLQMEQVSGL